MHRQVVSVAALSALVACTHAFAATNLVQNGSFENTYFAESGNSARSNPEQINFAGGEANGDASLSALGTFTVANWTSGPTGDNSGSAYNFVYNPTLAGAAAYSSPGNFGTHQLYTSHNGGNESVGAQNAPDNLASPDGGQFVSMSPVYKTAPLSQSISGLTIGDQYMLQFYSAGSSEPGHSQDAYGYSDFGVSLGDSAVQRSVTQVTPPGGFTPWSLQQMMFTADATTETLSFTPGGGPFDASPFSLLDGVSLTDVSVAVPEPTTAMLSLVAGAAMLRRNRRRSI